MSRFRPSELQGYLRSLGVKPAKGLSQNFLIDGNILDKIVALAEVTKDDTVVEIGPGPGALTERLLETGCKVIAVELDSVFANALTCHPQLTVHNADALKFDFSALGKVKVVANLPYAITTELLQKIIPLDNLVSATVMVQDEVARRLCFDCSAKDYVAFTLFLHYYCKPKYGFSVSPSCFYPAPRVTSAVMRLDKEKRFPVADEKQFFALVYEAFSHKRKMIKASLKEYPIEKALIAIGKAPTSRPEDLSVQEWVGVANLLN
ncbi:MAG: ribosomal RNA small subunit methyltransferase A [Verrucomicrobia bacterium]|nr:ribosomal RNA small subunit methyltransferase A [Verrucomicrobiota bacterium]MBS0637250.1 ribosomal RNA small subunit methyltransferase A [Verrucomicrobiota bacterium]